jgi:hypothetical protein
MSEIIEFIKNSSARTLKRKSKPVLRISELQQSLMESMLSNGQATSDASSDASFRGLFRIKFVETVGEVSPDKWTTYSLTQKAGVLQRSAQPRALPFRTKGVKVHHLLSFPGVHKNRTLGVHQFCPMFSRLKNTPGWIRTSNPRFRR